MFGRTKRTVLYYPTIDIPNDNWIRQGLLYWDNVASIVPQQIDVPLIQYSKDIEYILDNKIFRPIDPSKLDDGLYRHEAQEFKREFKDIVNSPEYREFLGPESEWILNSRIHEYKVSYDIAYFLKKLGLVKEKMIYEDNTAWHLFETKTAFLFMSLLARYLSKIEKHHTVPSTIFKKYKDLIYNPTQEDAGIKCTKALFDKILPVPRNNVPIEKIVELKQDHRRELLNFRKRVGVFQDDISKADDENKVKEIITSFSEEAELRVLELIDNLNNNKIEFGMNSLEMIINSPTLYTAIATLGAFGIAKHFGHDIPLEIGAIPTVLVGSIQVGTSYIKSRLKNSEMLKKSAFSYLYYAEKLA